MLKAHRLYTTEREKSDMADLEILGSISFDLEINKKDEIKKAFVSLVSKLGTKEFLEEYSTLYNTILTVRTERENSLFSIEIPDLDIEDIPEDDYIIGESKEPNKILETTILKEISISTDHVNKI